MVIYVYRLLYKVAEGCVEGEQVPKPTLARDQIRSEFQPILAAAERLIGRTSSGPADFRPLLEDLRELVQSLEARIAAELAIQKALQAASMALRDAEGQLAQARPKSRLGSLFYRPPQHLVETVAQRQRDLTELCKAQGLADASGLPGRLAEMDRSREVLVTQKCAVEGNVRTLEAAAKAYEWARGPKKGDHVQELYRKFPSRGEYDR